MIDSLKFYIDGVWVPPVAELGGRAGNVHIHNVHINNAPVDHRAPFGGFKQSGNGREWGVLGFEECFEVKAIMGMPPA